MKLIAFDRLPADATWIGCSHTVSAFSVILFHYPSAFEFCKDIEQALRGHFSFAFKGTLSLCFNSGNF
jgi:hypothetical protein